jgi:hypothetical protein
MGFLGPALYSLAEGSHYSTSIHDIIIGSNGFLTAPGYDLVTGWGSPAGQGLIDQLTGTQSSASFSIASSPASISIAPAGTASSTIAITPLNGFSGGVSLSVSGLPSGVTASFSSAGTTAPSVLTLSGDKRGGRGIVIDHPHREIGDADHHVCLEPYDYFSSRLQDFGQSGFDRPDTRQFAKTMITVTASGNFSGTVSLAASGLPSGVTATSRGVLPRTLLRSR